MKKNWKKALCLLLCLAMAFAFCACSPDAAQNSPGGSSTPPASGSPAQSGGQQPAQLKEFTVVLPHAIEAVDEMCLYLGMALGYYEEEGLDLKVIAADNPTDVQMCASGQVDLCVPSPTVFMTQIEAGLDVVMVGNYQPVNIFGYAVPPDSPIEKWEDITQDMSVLLGIPAWESICYPTLGAIGLEPQNMNYVIGGDARFTMEQEGQCDVLLTWISEYYQMEGMGYDFRFLCGEDVLPCIANGWVANRATLAEKGDDIAAFLRATGKSLYALYCSPEAAADAVLSEFPSLDITWEGAVGCAVGRVYHAFGMNADKLDYFTDEVGVEYIDEESIATTIDYCLKYGIITDSGIKPENIYTNDYVPAPFTQAEKDQIASDVAGYQFTSQVYLNQAKK